MVLGGCLPSTLRPLTWSYTLSYAQTDIYCKHAPIYYRLTYLSVFTQWQGCGQKLSFQHIWLCEPSRPLLSLACSSLAALDCCSNIDALLFSTFLINVQSCKARFAFCSVCAARSCIVMRQTSFPISLGWSHCLPCILSAFEASWCTMWMGIRTYCVERGGECAELSPDGDLYLQSETLFSPFSPYGEESLILSKVKLSMVYWPLKWTNLGA